MKKKQLKKIANDILKIVKKKEILPVPKPINTNKLLDGKVALITGGNGGIGRAIAKSFVESGCKVILTGRNENTLSDICEELEHARYIVMDVLDIDTLHEKIDLAIKLFPEERIDILVNSAGVRGATPFGKISEEEYDSVMDVNVKGTFFMCQVVSEYMIKNKIKGHILNVTSASALRPAWKPYQMSKWAIRGFTLGLADTLLPYGIIVNAIAPGPVATTMLGLEEGDSIGKADSPNGRYAMPSEIASLATFMVSDLGDLIVGDTFYITGGSGTISYHK